ncbi:MAG: dihydrolipoamide succinyltransferase, partial [Rhodospirillales bacterium]
MTVEIKVPVLGESVAEATVAKWFKKPGDAVALDEPLVELETDKVTVEVNSPVAGALASIIVPEGTDVEVGALLATIEEGAAGNVAVAPAPAPVATPAPAPVATPAPAPVATPA